MYNSGTARSETYNAAFIHECKVTYICKTFIHVW